MNRRKYITLLLCFILFFSLVTPALSAESMMTNKDVLSDSTISDVSGATVTDSVYGEMASYIIKFIDLEQGKQQLMNIGKSIDKSFKHFPLILTHMTASEASVLAGNENVEYIEPNYSVKIAGDLNEQEVAPERPELYEIPEVPHTNQESDRVNVAIFDTGIDSSLIMPAGGVSFVESESAYDDQNGHGTYVAGILSSLKDGQAVSEDVVPINIFDVKVLDQSGSGTYSAVIEAIEWAIDQKMDIINMSLAGTEHSAALQEAMEYACIHGILLLAPTGNDGHAGVSFPARYDSVLAVGAIDENNELAEFSNTGDQVDLVAPGVNIINPVSSDTANVMSGTSMAAAYVAGVASLIKSEYPKLSMSSIRNILEESATSLGEPQHFGKGKIDVQAALALAKDTAYQATSYKGYFTPEQIEKMKQLFTPEMLQVSAYFYPYLFDILDQQQKIELISWKAEEVLRRIDTFNDAQRDLLSAYVPLVVHMVESEKTMKEEAALRQSLNIADDHDLGPMLSTNTEPSLNLLNTTPVTELDKEYNFTVNTDDLVDPLYQSANRRVTDFAIQGKEGLDISLVRTFNSLNSKLLYPVFTDGNEVYTGTSSTKENYIATGWTLNIPYYDVNQVTPMIENQTSSSIVQYQEGTTQPRYIFHLEDGSSHEFRIQSGAFIPVDSHDQNMTVTLNGSGNPYLLELTVDGKIRYRFKTDGMIISKLNAYNDQVTYQYNNSSTDKSITITDSYNRVITINKIFDTLGSPNISIRGFKVEVGGQKIKEIRYNTQTVVDDITVRSWNPSTQKYDPLLKNIKFKQLISVEDITNTPKTLESYEYLPAIMGKADFNFKSSGYFYSSDSSGNPINNANWAKWRSNGQLIDSSVVMSIRNPTFGEMAYLLLDTIHFNNGLDAHFSYAYYNSTWESNNQYLEDQEAVRNIPRLYVDPYAIQYIGYNPVKRVDYWYADVDLNGNTNSGSLSTNYYYNHHLDHGIEFREYWKNEKANIKRLASSSRKGDEQVLEKREPSPNGFPLRSFQYYVNYKDSQVLGDFVLRVSWNKQEDYNPLYWTENGVQYSNKNDAVTIYEYTDKRPIRISQLAYNMDESNPKAVLTEVANPNTTNNRIMSRYTYDNWGYVVNEIDAVGNTITYQYNGPFHQITKKTVTSQDLLTKYTEEYAYYPDVALDPKRFQLQQYKRTQEYRLPGTTTVKTDVSIIDYVSYNSNHQLTKRIQSASGYQYGQSSVTTETNFTYTSQGFPDLETTKITLAQGQTPTNVTVGYVYDALGRITKITYPDGSYSQYGGYDYLDRVTSFTFQPASGAARSTSVTYNDDKRIATTTLPDGSAKIENYSPYGLLMYRQVKVNGATRVLLRNLSYEGKYIYNSLPYGQNALGTNYYYDTLGRIQSINSPESRTTTYEYSNFAENSAAGTKYLQNTVKTIYPNMKIEYTFYDKFGRLIKSWEVGSGYGKKRATTFTYSPLGQILAKTVTSEGQQQTTQYGYDADGNLIYVKDNNGTEYRYIYDRTGNILASFINDTLQKQQTYNEAGWLLKKINAGGQQENYKYLSTGLVDQFTDHANQTTTYSYSPYYEQNRVSVKNSVGTEIFWKQNQYDASTRLLTGVSNGENETLAYHYDQWKRMDVQTVAGRQYGFGYDAYDRLQTLTYPDAKQVSYTYDNLNRVTSTAYPDMGLVSNQYTIYFDTEEYHLNYPNQKEQTRVTDALGELMEYTHSTNGNVDWYANYGYDKFGNIQSIDSTAGYSNFLHDNMNRIFADSTPHGDNVYEYDEQGNRTTLDSTAAIPFPSAQTMTYNALNQLKTFTNGTNNASYTYYGDGLRATKTVNGSLTRYVYANGRVIEELDASGNVKARNIWGNELLYRKDYAANKGGYYYYNGHGDVVAIKDASGNFNLNTYDYDIWGNIVSQSETMSNPFKYTGENYDQESGLYYLRARYYDPSIGRFITEDTYKGQIDSPLSLNLYTYVYNNPLRFVDPTGFCASPYSFTGFWDCSMEGMSAFGNKMYTDASDVGQFFVDFTEDALNYVGPGTSVKSTAVYAAENSNSILTVAKSNVSKGWKKILSWFGKINYSKYAINATKNPKSTEFVLGKFNQDGVSYVKVAQDRGASYFQLDNWEEVVKEVGEENIWNINEKFIEQQINAGKKIILSHDPTKATGYYLKEVEFLIDKGYTFVSEGNYWKAIIK